MGRCRGRPRVNQITNRFRLAEIHLSVFAGSERELPWSSQPSVEFLSEIEELPYDHRRPVATDLDHILTGERIRALEKSDQGVIKNFSRVTCYDFFENHPVGFGIELQVIKKGAEDLERSWTT